MLSLAIVRRERSEAQSSTQLRHPAIAVPRGVEPDLANSRQSICGKREIFRRHRRNSCTKFCSLSASPDGKGLPLSPAYRPRYLEERRKLARSSEQQSATNCGECVSYPIELSNVLLRARPPRATERIGRQRRAVLDRVPLSHIGCRGRPLITKGNSRGRNGSVSQGRATSAQEHGDDG